MIADNIKCYKTITQPSDLAQLQGDINFLHRWSTVWNHKSLLTTLKILSLMYIHPKMYGIFYLLSQVCILTSHEGFNINNYISFASGDTCAAANHNM